MDDVLFGSNLKGYELYVDISASCEYSLVEGGDFDEEIVEMTCGGDCDIESIEFYYKGVEDIMTKNQLECLKIELSKIIRWA